MALVGVPLLGVCLLGCGSRQSEPNAAERTDAGATMSLEGAPNWVTGDCRDHFPDQPVICGVGSVSGVDSPTLARNTATARGRTEIARYLSIEVRNVLRDYQGVKGGVTEQEIEERSTQISEMTLNGSRVVSSFVAKDGSYYSLVALELEAFSSAVRQAETIDEPLKDALIHHASKAFSSRDGETSRY